MKNKYGKLKKNFPMVSMVAKLKNDIKKLFEKEK